jgi:hypothetical protein
MSVKRVFKLKCDFLGNFGPGQLTEDSGRLNNAGHQQVGQGSKEAGGIKFEVKNV